MKISKAGLSVIAALILSTVLLTGCGKSGASVPAAPTGVTATAGNGYATIGWPAVVNATTYNIYYAVAPAVPTVASGSKITGATSPCVVPGLSNGTTYTFVVTGVDFTGESPASAPATCSLAPRPSDVVATPVSGPQPLVNISWQPVTLATSYTIYWSSTPGVTPTTGTPISEVIGSPVPGSTALSYPQTAGLTNGTTYYYVVTAEVNGAETPPSFEASALPSALPPPAAPGFPLPPLPSVVAGNGQLTIYWTAPAGAISYNVYWSTSGNVNWSDIAGQVLPANVTKITGELATSFLHTGLNNGVTYYYVVTAVNLNGESPVSAQVSGTPLQ